MKNINALRTLAIFCTVVLIFFAGCHKVKNSSQPIALWGLHLHTYIGANVVNPGNGEYDQPLPDSNGRVEILQTASFYMTNIRLHNPSNNTFYTLPNSILLKRIENEEYIIDTVPAATYDYVQFTVGLNPALNAQTPGSQTGPDSVLSTYESSMWFGITFQSYKFMALSGLVDTTVNHTGDTSNFQPFNYSIGGTGDTVTISLPAEAFTIVPMGEIDNSVQLVHIICDYGHLLEGINMNNPANRTGIFTGTQTNAAQTIWSRIFNMFRYECVTPNTQC